MSVDPLRIAGDPQTRVAGTQTAELFEEHGRMIYGLCRTLLRDPDDADDATQSTFISAYKSLLGGSEVREPTAWLATIARNECTARSHARMREPLPLLEADFGHTQGPEAELERKAVVEELQQAISELPEKQREAVVLRDLYGLQYTEVSAALGMSVASVESLLFRARRSLRVSLKPLASGALVVPVAIREGIAQALPGFTTAGAAGGGAASGAVGLGLLAKFTGVPVALKIAAGVVAVTATGSVAVVGVEHAEKRQPSSMPAHVRPQGAGSNAPTAGQSLAGRRLFGSVFVRTDEGALGDDRGTEQAGTDDHDRESRDIREAATGATAGGSGGERSEHDGSPSGGDEVRTATRSGHDDGESGSTGSHDGSGSGDTKVPESGEDLLSTDASGSAGGESSSTSNDGSGTSDGSGSSGGSESSGSSESSDGDTAVTTPPPA